MHLKIFFTFLLLISISILKAQDQKVLTYEAFLEKVVKDHPIAKQIRLAQERARFIMMEANGNFDPELNSNFSYKQFGGKNYFNIFDSYLKIPTIIGIDPTIGYQFADGVYLNDSDKLPKAGQAYLGFNLPLGQGLINNERQTTLKQARVIKNAAQSEIKSAMNNLLFDAARIYWEWTLAYNSSLAWKQALDLANRQFEFIKNSYEQGDVPAVDTLKAFILIQDFEIQLNDTELLYRKAGWQLENYLWTDDSTALKIDDQTVPFRLENIKIETISNTEFENWMGNISSHPDIQLYEFQLKGLELEERLKKMKLLPKAELKYNLLSVNHVNFFENVGIAALTENYKLGFKFQYPILMRKERADLALNRIKQQETTFKMRFKTQEIGSKLQTYFNQVETYAAQVKRLDAMIENYAALVEAERVKFSLGESDLLIVNTREVQYIEAQQKRYKTIVKFLESKTAWTWATAQMN